MRINYKEYGISFKGYLDPCANKLISSVPIIYTDDEIINDNLLIEGENLYGLIALLPKYRKKVNFITIDVPYGTGSTGFYYDDKKVTKELDLDFNSKYCSTLTLRLKIARELLTDDGHILVFCDQNQFANIKTRILDPIFGDDNFCDILILQGNPGGRSDRDGLAITSEFCLIYRNSPLSKSYGIPKQGAGDNYLQSFRKGGSNDFWYDRTNMIFPFLVNKSDHKLSLTTPEEQKLWVETLDKNVINVNGQKKCISDSQMLVDISNYETYLINKYPNTYIVWPKSTKGYYSIWKWSYDGKKIQKEFNKLSYNEKSKSIQNLATKSEFENLKDNLKESQIDNKSFSNSSAKNYLSKMLKDYYKIDESKVKELTDSSTPKNPYLMRDLILNYTKENGIVFDFYGGTMMTYVGTLLANDLDQGERKFIGITNHEDDHFTKLAIPNITETEKSLDLFPLHTVCKIKLADAPTQDDKWENFFHNEQNILFDDTINPDSTENIILQSTIESTLNMFKN